MSWDHTFHPYVTAATRQAQAARAVQRFAKKGQAFTPVKVVGRIISRTFWGQAWCKHLEALGDYGNRLPRGRTYLRNGSVLDLQISPGRIKARVMGSTLYEQTIEIAPLAPSRWTALKAACAGQIDSLVELLQGRLSAAVMTIITDPQTGLFPSPREIARACTCPDSSILCKHLAAVLYGVAARLDERPELLFVLRGVDHLDLISSATAASSLAGDAASLGMENLADIFGIELAELPAPHAAPAIPPVAKPVRRAAKSAPKPKAQPRTTQKKPPAPGKTARSAIKKAPRQPVEGLVAAPARSARSADPFRNQAFHG